MFPTSLNLVQIVRGEGASDVQSPNIRQRERIFTVKPTGEIIAIVGTGTSNVLYYA